MKDQLIATLNERIEKHRAFQTLNDNEAMTDANNHQYHQGAIDALTELKEDVELGKVI